MAASIDPQFFLQTMLPVVRQCARASLIFYGQISDIGKDADTSLTGSVAQRASSVLTAIDSAVQDIILSVVLEHFPAIRCIAEENTPLRRRFAGNDSPYALILDPIDGTVHFQKGDAPYHISLGLAHDGRMVAAIVARPNEDKIFTALAGAGAYLHLGKGRPRRLRLGKRPRTRRIFISSKARAYQEAVRPDLDPRDYPIGAALVLTQVAEGELCAYLTRQVEVYDVGPPSLIATEAGARCALRGGRAPSYRNSRKFSYYMCTASAEIESTLSHLLRSSLKK